MLTPRLQKLHNGPNSNMLKSGIGAAQKSMEILVHAPFRLFPYVVEGRIIIGSPTTIWYKEKSLVTNDDQWIYRTLTLRRQISKRRCAVPLNFRAGRIREWYKDLADPHFQ